MRQSCATMTPPAAKEQRTKPNKTVLLVGDKSIKQLKRQLAAQLPKKASLVVRWTSKKDAVSILELADKFLQSNDHPVHIIVHGGHEECLEFQKDRYLSEISAFAQRTMAKRSDCSWSIITIPQFTKECREANEELKKHQETLRYDIIDVTHAHRPMVTRGFCSYSKLDDTAEACAKAMARKATFLDVKIAPTPKPSKNVRSNTIYSALRLPTENRWIPSGRSQGEETNKRHGRPSRVVSNYPKSSLPSGTKDNSSRFRAQQAPIPGRRESVAPEMLNLAQLIRTVLENTQRQNEWKRKPPSKTKSRGTRN